MDGNVCLFRAVPLLVSVSRGRFCPMRSSSHSSREHGLDLRCSSTSCSPGGSARFCGWAVIVFSVVPWVSVDVGSSLGLLLFLVRENGRVLLSLVALVASRIVGHILYSPATVGAALGPMSVDPDHQRQGIGSRRVKTGNARLAESGCPFVIVIGHADFYTRFGFTPAGALSWNLFDRGDHAAAGRTRFGELVVPLRLRSRRPGCSRIRNCSSHIRDCRSGR
jgi:GNAT superfamily N-acetyltransferase